MTSVEDGMKSGCTEPEEPPPYVEKRAHYGMGVALDNEANLFELRNNLDSLVESWETLRGEDGPFAEGVIYALGCLKQMLAISYRTEAAR